MVVCLDIAKDKIYVARYISFDESLFSFKMHSSSSFSSPTLPSQPWLIVSSPSSLDFSNTSKFSAPLTSSSLYLPTHTLKQTLISSPLHTLNSTLPLSNPLPIVPFNSITSPSLFTPSATTSPSETDNSTSPGLKLIIDLIK